MFRLCGNLDEDSDPVGQLDCRLDAIGCRVVLTTWRGQANRYKLGGSERALPCRRLHPAFPLVERGLRYAFVLTKLSDGHLRLLEPFQTLGPKQSGFGWIHGFPPDWELVKPTNLNPAPTMVLVYGYVDTGVVFERLDSINRPHFDLHL